jgi:uncharacterized damage-inducible protein DinB
MGQRSNELADRFEKANNAVIAAVERCSDEQWKKTCSEEGWSVAVTAHHVGVSHEGIAGLVNLVATGKPTPPITMEMIDAGNAEHARASANCTKEETLALLREKGKAAAEMLRGFSDGQLDRTAPLTVAGGAEMSAEQIINRILIGHPENHLESIKQATAS